MLLRLVEGGGQDVGAKPTELHAVGSALGLIGHPGARLLGRGDGDLAAHPEEDVGLEPRSRDLVPRALLLFLDRPGQPVARAGIAHGGDPVAHPQLEDVLRGRALLEAADVAVHVDEARQHVVAREVDLLAVRLELRALGGVDGHSGKADVADVRDAVALDHDVHRAEGRRPRAVDEGDPAQDELLPRSLALGARRRLQDGLGLVLLGEGAASRSEAENQGRHHGDGADRAEGKHARSSG